MHRRGGGEMLREAGFSFVPMAGGSLYGAETQADGCAGAFPVKAPAR